MNKSQSANPQTSASNGKDHEGPAREGAQNTKRLSAIWTPVNSIIPLIESRSAPLIPFPLDRGV
jgi:hypothetical protein